MTISTHALILREWQYKCQSMHDWAQPLALFVIIITLFAIAVGGAPNLLAQIGAPIVWTAILLCQSTSAETLFRPDVENGMVAQIMLAQSMVRWVWVRVLFFWVFGAGFLALISVLALPLFNLSSKALWVLWGSAVLGTPMLSCMTAIAHALTLGLKNSALLVPIIALPMQLPILIFAIGAVDASAMGLNSAPVLMLLGGLSLLAMVLTPPLVAWILANSAH